MEEEEQELPESILSQATAGHAKALESAYSTEIDDSGSESEPEELTDEPAESEATPDEPTEEIETETSATSQSQTAGSDTISQRMGARPRAVAADITGGTMVLTRYV